MEWIKCSDEVPSRTKDVLVFCSDTKEQMVGFHIGNGDFQFAQFEGVLISCHPTHWMPLPAPPAE
jgi:hypothetical protein